MRPQKEKAKKERKRYQIKKFRNGRKRYINMYGVEFTESEYKKVKKYTSRINKIRSILNKDTKRSQKYRNLGLESPDEIQRRSQSLHQFKNKGLFKAWLKRQEELLKDPQKFIQEKRTLLHNNYLKALLQQFSVDPDSESEETIKSRMGDTTRKLYEKIKNMSDDEFITKFDNGEIPEINELYQSPEYIDEYIEETYAEFMDEV